jgi:ABC-2 type transport system permease protein
MTAGTQAVLRPASRPWSRVMGLGSIYGKTVRDSRRAALIVGVLAGMFMLMTAAPYGLEFTTAELRAQLVTQMTTLPAVFRGLLGEPIAIETLGGFLSWRVGNILPVMLGLWSVIALSGTLAGEAGKGSLDLLVATQHSRTSIALQKLAGHVTALVAAMLIAGLLIFAAGLAFKVLPEDGISLGAAFGQVTLYGLLMLAAGSIGFATGPVVGRARAMAFGLIALFGMYLIASYGSLSPALDALAPLSWYAWTEGHRPLAGITDWASLALLAVVTIALLAAGVLAFGRRDIGASAALAWLRLPALPAGIAGPFTRQLADRAGIALAWGAGVGLYSALIATSAPALTETLNGTPGLLEVIEVLYPDLDMTQPSGILQLAFFAFGSLMLGLAGATALAGWASDEGRRRLDVVLTHPISRIGWALRTGLGVLAAVAIAAAGLGVLTTIGVAAVGGSIAEPIVGVVVLGLAVAGLTSIGFAAGGLVRSSLAAPVAALVVIVTFVLDTLGAALDLPEWVLDLSIYRHLGQPMTGQTEVLGVGIALVLIVAGLAVGAWGLQRRDVGR